MNDWVNESIHTPALRANVRTSDRTYIYIYIYTYIISADPLGVERIGNPLNPLHHPSHINKSMSTLSVCISISVYKSYHTSLYRYISIYHISMYIVYRYIGISVYRYIDISYIGISLHRCIDILIYRYIDIYLYMSIFVYRYIGI